VHRRSQSSGDSWSAARAAPILAVANRLGLNLRKGSNRCPFPSHADLTPSFALYPIQNRFKCFGCGVGGSSIDLVASYLKMSPVDAVNWINRDIQHAKQHTKRTVEDHRSKLQVNAIDTEIYSDLIGACPILNDGIAYLEGRSISLSTIEQFRVGQIASADGLLQTLLKRWGEDRVRRAGLLEGNCSRMRLAFGTGRLLFPFFESEMCVYIQSRAVSDTSQPRWKGLNGVRKPIFNSSALSSDEIYICEGITDVLSAHELGLSAIGLLGAHDNIPLAVLRQMRGKTVYVVGDNDPSGRKMAQAQIRLLSKAGIDSKRKELEHGKDLNDFLGFMRSRHDERLQEATTQPGQFSLGLEKSTTPISSGGRTC